MVMTWFKLHHEIIEDPKIAMMGETDQLIWFKLLCLASADRERGNVSLNDEEIAFKLRCSKETWLHAKDKFRAKGLIEPIESKLQIINWEKRQYAYPSDRPEATKSRKCKQRANSKKIIPSKKAEDVTIVTSESRVNHESITRLSQQYHDTDPDTDLDPESESEKDLKKENTIVVEPPEAPRQRSRPKVSKFQEEFLKIYNESKPQKWAAVQIPPPDLLTLIEKNRKAIADDELAKTYLKKALSAAAADNFWKQKETGKWSLINLLRKGNMITLAEVAGELDCETANDHDRIALYERLWAEGNVEALLRPIDCNKEPEEHKRRFEFYQRKNEEEAKAYRQRAQEAQEARLATRLQSA